MAAGHKSSPAAREALSALCTAYWYPLYAFVRRSGYSAVDAEDLTQAFFARLLEKNDLAAADRQRGRFRSFLLSAMKHFLANQRHRARAKKRGGGRAILPLDFAAGESHYKHEPADAATPEKIYHRRWAIALLDRVINAVREEYDAQGKLSQFDHLKVCLEGRHQRHNYRQLAERCGMSEGAVKVAVHRLRRRYRRRLREEIEATVASPEEVEDEIRTLFAAFED